MDFSKLVIITGKTGVFRIISQGRTALIVESLIDGKKIPIPLSYKATSLKEIVIFTYDGDLPLLEVFEKIKDYTNAQQAISHKEDDNNIKNFFEQILPNYDKRRVYLSDMKKVLLWYNILNQNGINNFVEETKNNEVNNEMESKTKADAEQSIENVSNVLKSELSTQPKVQKQLGLFEAETNKIKHNNDNTEVLNEKQVKPKKPRSTNKRKKDN